MPHPMLPVQILCPNYAPKRHNHQEGSSLAAELASEGNWQALVPAARNSSKTREVKNKSGE